MCKSIYTGRAVYVIFARLCLTADGGWHSKILSPYVHSWQCRMAKGKSCTRDVGRGRDITIIDRFGCPALGIAIGPADLFEFKLAGPVEWLGLGGAVGSRRLLHVSFLGRRVAGSWGRATI